MIPRSPAEPRQPPSPDAWGADPDELRVAAARLRARAAAAGVDPATGWLLRLAAPADPDAAWRILAAGRATRPDALLRRHRDGSRQSRAALLWMDDGTPLARALGTFADPGAAWSPGPAERLAAAARLCDGVAMRLGLGRGALRLAGSAAILPLRRRKGPDGWGWSADSPAPPAAGWAAPDAAALAARLADLGVPALVAAVEGGALVAAPPPLSRFDDFRELVFALDEAAAAQGVPVILDGAPAPSDPLLRVAEASCADGELALKLAPAPGGWTGPSAAPMAALWRAAAAEAGPIRSATLTLADAPGRPSRLAARPDAVARIVAGWLARPGLASLLGQSGPRSAAALGPLQATAVDLALAAASTPGAATPSTRFAALARALEGADLRPERTPSGGALVWDDLAPPSDPAAACLVEAVALALLAHGLRDRPVARAPAWLGGPADRWLLPSVLWPDAAAAVAERAPDAPTLTGWLRRAFDARFTPLGVVDAPGLRLSVRLAGQFAPGGLRVEALVEGPLVDGSGLWIDGRAAPLGVAPQGGGRLCGVILRSGPAARSVDARGGTPPPAPAVIAVAPETGGSALVAARLEDRGAGLRLVAAPDGRVYGRWAPRPDPRQPMTLDLRAPDAQ